MTTTVRLHTCPVCGREFIKSSVFEITCGPRCASIQHERHIEGCRIGNKRWINQTLAEAAQGAPGWSRPKEVDS